MLSGTSCAFLRSHMFQGRSSVQVRNSKLVLPSAVTLQCVSSAFRALNSVLTSAMRARSFVGGQSASEKASRMVVGRAIDKASLLLCSSLYSLARGGVATESLWPRWLNIPAAQLGEWLGGGAFKMSAPLRLACRPPFGFPKMGEVESSCVGTLPSKRL